MAFPTGWSYYKVGTIDHTYVGSTLTDFPLLARKASDSDINTHALSNGNDIRFSSDSGSPTEYPFGHVGSFSAGNLLEYLKVPSISTVVDTTFRVWYGNPGASDGQQKSSAPDSNTKLFVPLDDTPTGSAGDILDWTGNHNGTSSGGPTSVAGEVGNCLSFDGSNDTVDFGSFNPTDLTVSVWLKMAAKSGYEFIVSRYDGSSVHEWIPVEVDNTGKLASFFRDDGSHRSSGVSIDDNAWHHCSITITGITLKHYVDGSLAATTTVGAGCLTSSSINWRLGLSVASAFPYGGSADGLEIIDGVRSADWISFDYQNQKNNRVSWGSEQSAGGAGTFTASAAVSFQAATLAASCTFRPGTHTAAAAVSTQSATLAATATFSGGTHHATAAISTQPLALSASCTFGGGTHTAGGALTLRSATLSASCLFATAVRQATAALSLQAATLAASVHFSGGTHTAASSLTLQATTLSASCTFRPGTHTASAAVATRPLTLAAIVSTVIRQTKFPGTATLVRGGTGGTLNRSLTGGTLVRRS